MKICPRCGTENSESTDFCVVCGEYLRWEPTRALDAVAPSDALAGTAAAEGERALAEGEPPLEGEPAPVSSQPVVDAEVTLPPGAAAVAPVRTEAPAGAATLLLRLPDDDAAATGPVDIAVKPGERVVLLGLIRNESGIVDNYDIAVSWVAGGLVDGRARDGVSGAVWEQRHL